MRAWTVHSPLPRETGPSEAGRPARPASVPAAGYVSADPVTGGHVAATQAAAAEAVADRAAAKDTARKAPRKTPRRRAGPGLVLVPEGFSLAAALLPPLWFLRHGLWLVLVLYLALSVLAALLLPEALRPYAWFGAHWLVGLHAQDLRRWTLARRGLPVAAVVLGANEELALLRALDGRPALAGVEARDLLEGKAA